MCSTMKVENCCYLQPLSNDQEFSMLEKYSSVVDNANLTRIESEGFADENKRRPITAHYESLPLEEPEDTVSMTISSSACSVPNSILWKTALSKQNLLLKSSSLPNPENNVFDLPDPFPELTQERLAPVSAQMYGAEKSSSSLPNSPEKQAELSASRPRGAFPRSATCGFNARTIGNDDIVGFTSQNKMKIDIHVNAQKCHSVEIDDNTTVAFVCDHLDKLTRSKRDPFWTIVEHVDKFNIERSLEDHELLVPILKSWNSAKNHLFFRKDYCRYELYSNPNQCFPEHMLDVQVPKEDSASFMTHSELYRNLLLKCLLANQSMPDIQGYLHVRDGKKGWKKYFCVLRHSGLYYITKGCVKNTQNMVLLSDLTNDNIYVSLNSKKTFSAPTQHCFCLAPSNDVSDKHKLRLFCTEDEQSRLCWMTGMRFIKFGAQLHENCRAFVSCNSSCSETTNERVNGCISKVCDKVVVNPVIKVPTKDCRENYQTTRQRCLISQLQYSLPRNADSKSPDSSTSILQASVSSNCNPCNLEWFHDTIGREEAVSLLSNSGLKEGTFLVRHSQTLSGVYVLSFVHSGTVKHCTIHKIKLDDNCYYSLDGGSTKFMDLVQLIDFYRLNAGLLPTRLVCHVARLN